MKRKLLLVLAFIALPGFANALGLGKLQLNSALNQPLDARIELLSASADEIESLNVGLADNAAFRRARIDRPFVLSKLKFEVKEVEDGADYIQVSSRDSIREPFLNFLLEAGWSSGRLYREYTVLLDPPLYDPNANRSSRTTDTYTPSSSTSSESYIVDDSDSEAASEPSSTGLIYSDNEYGPTSGSDTLWSIATKVRPDNSVSVQQMMLALLRANPDAFVNGNINGLKRGQILTIPERDEINSLSSQDALSDVKSQNSSWQETRGMLAESVTDRAESMSTSDDISQDSSADSAAMIEDDESELRLVAASSDGAGQDAGDNKGDSSASLALANEQFEVVSQENAELKDRMREAETIIEDLKRLISLKDDELAALQQQMASGGIAVEEAEEAEVMVEGEEEPVEEVYEEVAEDLEEEEVVDEAVEEDDLMSEATDEDVIEEDDEEGLVSEDAGEVDEEVLGDEEESAMEEEVVAATVETAPPAGLLDQVIGFITGNLILIGGALGGIIIVIIVILFISRRRQTAAIEPASAAITEFPDFDEPESESETVAPEADADAEIDMSQEETVSPDSDAEEDEGKTEFVAPPEIQEEAAAPEPEEPEEDPLAEVNVFLAYEHFDQAEEFVREAISGNPDNLDFHAKLLEVFYAANDLKSYEDAAQVLHDKVGGEGQHWEMAQAMWQEMSPNRALFEEGGDDVAAPAPAADASGGIMDITANEEADAADASVDFDLGMDMGAEPAEAEAEDVLDITASGDEEDLLDVTAAAGVDGSSSDEDLLDVTAAVGLDTEEFAEVVESIAAEDDEPMLDITGGGAEETAAEEDVLDISHVGGEDLLDVTANANLEADGLEEDLLDVTSSVGAEADGEELLEVPAEEPVSDDDGSVDFDIGGMDPEPEVADEIEADVSTDETAEDDNALDFDIGGMEEEAEVADDDGGIELDLSTGDDFELSDEAVDNNNEISIDDLSDVSEEDVELDLSIDESDDSDSLDIGDLEMDADDAGLGDDLEIDLTLDDGSEEAEAESLDDDLTMDFDLEIEDDAADAPEIDMDGTMEMPKADLDDLMDIDDDDDDDEDDHTVFVPRAGAADEQTAEDEIATKLDLAKAYVELGDKDSAKGILDEVMADGNEEQKRTAQDLISQLD